MRKTKSNSALSGYSQVYLVHADIRLTYQILSDNIQLINKTKPYLDCYIQCGCGVYYHHLSFKRKTKNKYTCPGGECKGLDLRKGVKIR